MRPYRRRKMFLETQKIYFEKLVPYLRENNIRYEVSDCTLPGETETTLHIEFLTEIAPKQIETINNKLDEIYAKTNEHIIDLDGNGIADNIDKAVEEEEIRQQNDIHREWDQKIHTPLQEAKGWFTGENER